MTSSSKLTFAIASDLYRAGYTDDGQEFIAEVFYVVAENDHGDRWEHTSRFPGCKVDGDEWGTGFADIRPEATAKAARLLARIEAAGGRIDLAHWRAGRPVYGSDAYVAYGADDDRAWEARCNEEESLGLR